MLVLCEFASSAELSRGQPHMSQRNPPLPGNHYSLSDMEHCLLFTNGSQCQQPRLGDAKAGNICNTFAYLHHLIVGLEPQIGAGRAARRTIKDAKHRRSPEARGSNYAPSFLLAADAEFLRSSAGLRLSTASPAQEGRRRTRAGDAFFPTAAAAAAAMLLTHARGTVVASYLEQATT